MVALAGLGLGLLVAGCGSSAPSATTTYIAAGQVPKADLPQVNAHGGVKATEATIPLAKQNPTTALVLGRRDRSNPA